MNEPVLHPPPRRRPPQMSLGFMMLMMVIFAIMSAGLLYASRVPAVQDEIQALLGKEAVSSEDVGHTAHLAFILFTLTSPLLLAAVLSTGLSVLRWRARQKEPRF